MCKSNPMDYGDESVVDEVDCRPSPEQIKAGKPAIFWGLLAYFPRALAEVAKVSMFGSTKHGKPLQYKGFLSDAYPIEMFDDAIGRHLLALAQEGEVNTADGDVYHRAQIMWSAAAGLEKLLIEKDKEK